MPRRSRGRRRPQSGALQMCVHRLTRRFTVRTSVPDAATLRGRRSSSARRTTTRKIALALSSSSPFAGTRFVFLYVTRRTEPRHKKNHPTNVISYSAHLITTAKTKTNYWAIISDLYLCWPPRLPFIDGGLATATDG